MDVRELQKIKNRYDIIGQDPALNRAIEIAYSVAPTDLTVLISGESGVGKDNIPKIVHQNSIRRTGKYFAVNCGAIPEGTIDSELFGHEKGAFTGAIETRKGYFEEANGGTLFLDEIGELPLSSQAKLLRVLQSGEFMRVGSAKVLKTDVRVVAATNVNLQHAVAKGKFREDLYYRLNAISIKVPALRDRGDDIYLLFRKFAADFSEKYRFNTISLSTEAIIYLCSYRWPGNIRQLKNFTESISVLESGINTNQNKKYELGLDVIQRYLPLEDGSTLPVVSERQGDSINSTEKEAIIRMIYQLRQEVDYLKKVINEGTHAPASAMLPSSSQQSEPEFIDDYQDQDIGWHTSDFRGEDSPEEQEILDLSIHKAGADLIKKALDKHNGNRKLAAKELGISERTLYRKIKNIEENED